MKIMLTGSNGYIGSKIHAALNAKGGYEVSTFDEFGDKDRWLTRFEAEFNQHFDWVIHAGAIMDTAYTKEDLFWWNYHCTKKIVNNCKEYASKLLFFSTSQAISPFNLYGWSKRCAADYVESHLSNCCIIQPYVVYGDEYGRPSKLSSVGKLIKGELQAMFEPWERDWIHVRDVVRSIVHILDNDITGIYDIGTGEGYTARQLFERWGEPLPRIVGPGEPPYPEGAPARLVGERLLPDFECRNNVLEYLEEMKQYGNKVY